MKSLILEKKKKNQNHLNLLLFYSLPNQRNHSDLISLDMHVQYGLCVDNP